VSFIHRRALVRLLRQRLVNVARYHLVDRIAYVALPWGILAFSFLINLAIAAMAPAQPGGMHTGGW